MLLSTAAVYKLIIDAAIYSTSAQTDWYTNVLVLQKRALLAPKPIGDIMRPLALTHELVFTQSLP